MRSTKRCSNIPTVVVVVMEVMTAINPIKASLPINVGRTCHVPGEYIPKNTPPIPIVSLHDEKTRLLNLNDVSIQPLMISIWDSNDPFSSFMLSSNSSIDSFVSMMIEDDDTIESHFLFSCWHSRDDLKDLMNRFSSRMNELEMSSSPSSISRRRDERRKLSLLKERLLFTSQPAFESVLGSTIIADTLSEWQSPRNGIEIRSGKNVTMMMNRLDCHYGFCPWPNPPSQKINIHSVVLGNDDDDDDPCHEIVENAVVERRTQETTLPLYLLIRPSCNCTAELAALSAEGAGYDGVIVISDKDQPIRPVGLFFNDDNQVKSVSIPTTSVSNEDGRTLTKLIRSNVTQTSLSSWGGIGQFLILGENGRLLEMGWEKYSTLRMIGWEAQYSQFRARMNRRLSSEAVFIVPIFHDAYTGTQRVVSMPSTNLMNAFSTLELDLSLHCPSGVRDQDCSVWDRIVSVSVECPGYPEMELGRWINPFQRRGRWLTPTPLFSRDMLGGNDCTFSFRVDINDAWRITLNLRFLPRTTNNHLPAIPNQLMPIRYPNQITKFDGPQYNQNRTIQFLLPPETTQVFVVALITGHGSCEFRPTSHHFVLNHQQHHQYNTFTPPEYYQRFMLAGTQLGCANYQTKRGAVPNEHGTWYYGRNGWCDGQDVKPLLWDVTPHIHFNAGVLNTLTYYALSYHPPDDLASEDGCGGYIKLSTFLAFYSNSSNPF